MLDSIGSFGVKRLKPDLKKHVAGVLGYCRKIYADQVPFDDEFRIDDSRLYCVEMTEKAFRSQGLALSEPVCIGDWENLVQYPLTAMGIVHCSRWFVKNAITLDQPTYVPGNDHQGIWASPLLETVYPYAKSAKAVKSSPPGPPPALCVKGDLAVTAFAFREVGRSYSQLPLRLIGELLAKAPASDTSPRVAADTDRVSVTEVD